VSAFRCSATVAKSGKSLKLKPTNARKPLTPEGEAGGLASLTDYTFFSVGSKPCLEKRKSHVLS